MRVKFFSRMGWKGYYRPEDHQGLEDEVNTWLEQNRGVKVLDIRQSASGGSLARPQLFVTILYEPSS